MGVSSGFTPRAWLQKGGCGRGGEAKDVRYDTFRALEKKELVKKKHEGFPTSTYKLTDKAKLILKEEK